MASEARLVLHGGPGGLVLPALYRQDRLIAVLSVGTRQRETWTDAQIHLWSHNSNRAIGRC